MKQGQHPEHDGLCYHGCGRASRPGQRDCRKCHADGERARRAMADFDLFVKLTYAELEREGGVSFTRDELRTSGVMMAAEKVWLRGRV